MENQLNLEKVSATTAIVGIVVGLFFLSENITGDVIGSLNTSTSNIIGVVLLLVGLVGAFFILERNNFIRTFFRTNSKLFG